MRRRKISSVQQVRVAQERRRKNWDWEEERNLKANKHRAGGKKERPCGGKRRGRNERHQTGAGRKNETLGLKGLKSWAKVTLHVQASPACSSWWSGLKVAHNPS